MSSLYHIQQDLEAILYEIEENDGEITDELAEQLAITEDELKTKLESYVHTINTYNAFVDECKAEKTRINNLQNVRKNRVERLKKAVLDAVLLYGGTGRAGNKVIELPTLRLSTRSSKEVEIDTTRIEYFIRTFKSYLNELYLNGVIYIGEDVSLKNILDEVNKRCKQYEDNWVDFTLNDLTTLKVTISTTDTIYNLMRDRTKFIEGLVQHDIYAEISNATTKEDIKKGIEKSQISDTSPITIGNIKINQNLQIK